MTFSDSGCSHRFAIYDSLLPKPSSAGENFLWCGLDGACFLRTKTVAARGVVMRMRRYFVCCACVRTSHSVTRMGERKELFMPEIWISGENCLSLYRLVVSGGFLFCLDILNAASRCLRSLRGTDGRRERVFPQKCRSGSGEAICRIASLVGCDCVVPNGSLKPYPHETHPTHSIPFAGNGHSVRALLFLRTSLHVLYDFSRFPSP